MAPKTFRRLAVPGLIGSALFCQAIAQAQSIGVRAVTNDEAVIEWKASSTLDAYTNHVDSAGGTLNTPLRSGDFYRHSASGDLRVNRPGQLVDYLQGAVTHSNDPAVLNRARHQVDSLQAGRIAPGYALAAGDITPAFSSLGSSLGVRGIYGQRALAGVVVSGFTGTVAESWEALGHQVPRNQYLKDVQGLKIEKMFGPSLRTYVTGQGMTERGDAGSAAYPLTAPHGQSRSATGGFQYQQGALGVAGEVAASRFEDAGQGGHDGHAGIVDATWRLSQGTLRAGHHDLSSGFTSLSVAALPGVRESYVGGDWPATSWLTLSGDLRRSRSTAFAPAGISASYVETDSASTGAALNFGPAHPGWSLALQQAVSRSTDSAGLHAANRDLSASLSYANAEWNASLSLGRGRVSSEVFADGDASSNHWSASAGRTWSDARTGVPASWSVRTSVSATSRTQLILASGQTRDNSVGLVMAAQRAGWGSLNVVATAGEITRPLGGPALRQRGLQVDATCALGSRTSLKAWLRGNRRNAGDVFLQARENAIGLQLTTNF